jgi:Bacterial HORMA domain family 1
MSYSFSYTESSTFTVTHARHMAAKVATDLKRMQRFYGSQSDAHIASYEVEVIALIKVSYLGVVTYGYKKDGKWIEPTLRYTARELTGATANDDDPVRIQPGPDMSGAVFHSPLSTLTSAGGSILCFRRDYSPDHLARHPKQMTKSVLLAFQQGFVDVVLTSRRGAPKRIGAGCSWRTGAGIDTSDREFQQGSGLRLSAGHGGWTRHTSKFEANGAISIVPWIGRGGRLTSGRAPSATSRPPRRFFGR